MDGNEFLKETVLFMRNYVVENQLEGFKESMQSHAELNEKALFLTSAQTYIEGLCQQNKSRENEQEKSSYRDHYVCDLYRSYLFKTLFLFFFH